MTRTNKPVGISARLLLPLILTFCSVLGVILLRPRQAGSTTNQQQYKLRRRTKLSKAFNRFETNTECDLEEMV